MIYVNIYDVLLCYILFTLSLPAHSLNTSYLSLATELQRNAKRQTVCLISRANNCTLSTVRLQAIAGCGIMRAMGQTAIVTVCGSPQIKTNMGQSDFSTGINPIRLTKKKKVRT